MFNIFGENTSKKRSKRSIENDINILRVLIGHDNWCIAGSYAALEVKHPNDIDVFFHTEEDYNTGLAHVYSIEKGAKDSSYVTANATSLHCSGIELPIQFIVKHFGTSKEIIKTFDLNVCKRAILPDGTRVADPRSYETLTIDSVTASTFARYFKYLSRSGQEKNITDLGKALIDAYIGDSTMIKDYYNNNRPTLPTNLAMFSTVCNDPSLEAYAYEQAAIHAPELLI